MSSTPDAKGIFTAFDVDVEFWLIITNTLVARRWRVTARPMTFRASLHVHAGSPIGHGRESG
jgi:hypothetical protein